MDVRRALSVLAVFAACIAQAAEAPSSAIQQRIKAAFLSKFAAYVEWPPEAFAQRESPLVIGVAGAEAIARELDQAIAGRTVAGRALTVRRVASAEQAADCCQILFVGADNGPERAADLVAHASGRPTLTVTDLEDPPRGSVINFVIADDRVRFDVSRGAAQRNKLQLRSQLLAVARQVTPE